MRFHRAKSMTPRQAAEAMHRGDLQLVDVREPAELAHARIGGATHIPLGQLKSRLGELDRHRAVAFLCASGTRSGVAARAAVKAGLDASNVLGGIKAWTRAGLPVTTASPRGAA